MALHHLIHYLGFRIVEGRLFTVNKDQVLSHERLLSFSPPRTAYLVRRPSYAPIDNFDDAGINRRTSLLRDGWAMIVTTTENIPGTRVVKTIGQVFGLTVRSRSLGGNIAAALKGLVGGEIGRTSSSTRIPGARLSTAWCRTPPLWGPTP
jgi:hypothetical protein